MGKSLIIKGADFSANKIIEGRGVQLSIQKGAFWIIRPEGRPSMVNNGQYNYIEKTPCHQGDIFFVTGQNEGDDTRCWAFINSEGVTIKLGEKNTKYTNEKIVAPQNAAFFIGSCKNIFEFAVFKS